MPTDREFVLTLSCRDTKGIVHAVSGLLYQAGCNIVDSQQFGDVMSADATGLFFMRTVFHATGERLRAIDDFRLALAPVAQRFAMQFALHDASRRMKVLLAVSRHGHCLNHLLHRWHSGELPVDVAGVGQRGEIVEVARLVPRLVGERNELLDRDLLERGLVPSLRKAG